MSTADMRPRLDSVVAKARAELRETLAENDIREAIVAVSGGADSLALAAVVSFFVRRGELAAQAVIVDHQLQAGSHEVAQHASVQCRGLGLEAHVVTVDVDGTDEAAARMARYRALRDAAQGRAIFLAHTLDDQAETVLLGLGRGSGARSLRAMVRVDGDLIRPFLGMRRSETERICRFHGLEWWTDPHNTDPRFRRVRVRTELLPLAEDILAGGVAEALARTATQLRDDNEALDQWAQSVHTDDIHELAGLPSAVRRRVLRQLCLEAGADPSRLSAHHLHQVDSLVTTGKGPTRHIELPGGIFVRRERSRLLFASTPVTM